MQSLIATGYEDYPEGNPDRTQLSKGSLLRLDFSSRASFLFFFFSFFLSFTHISCADARSGIGSTIFTGSKSCLSLSFFESLELVIEKICFLFISFVWGFLDSFFLFFLLFFCTFEEVKCLPNDVTMTLINCCFTLIILKIFLYLSKWLDLNINNLTPKGKYFTPFNYISPNHERHKNFLKHSRLNKKDQWLSLTTQKRQDPCISLLVFDLVVRRRGKKERGEEEKKIHI